MLEILTNLRRFKGRETNDAARLLMILVDEASALSSDDSISFSMKEDLREAVFSPREYPTVWGTVEDVKLFNENLEMIKQQVI